MPCLASGAWLWVAAAGSRQPLKPACDQSQSNPPPPPGSHIYTPLLQVVPIITKLFTSHDRGIRRGLLENIASFGPGLPDAIVEDQARLACGLGAAGVQPGGAQAGQQAVPCQKSASACWKESVRAGPPRPIAPGAADSPSKALPPSSCRLPPTLRTPHAEHHRAPRYHPQIYTNVAAGFADANPYLRELTLKAMAVLGPKLSQKSLSQSLLKHLAKLQVRGGGGAQRTGVGVCSLRWPLGGWCWAAAQAAGLSAARCCRRWATAGASPPMSRSCARLTLACARPQNHRRRPTPPLSPAG